MASGRDASRFMIAGQARNSNQYIAAVLIIVLHSLKPH